MAEGEQATWLLASAPIVDSDSFALMAPTSLSTFFCKLSANARPPSSAAFAANLKAHVVLDGKAGQSTGSAPQPEAGTLLPTGQAVGTPYDEDGMQCFRQSHW